MYKINVPKLDGKMVEKGFTKSSYAKAIGISRNTLDNYRKRPSIIPYWVLSKMIFLVCDSTEDLFSIFFTQ